jgi:hypothetical protein
MHKADLEILRHLCRWRALVAMPPKCSKVQPWAPVSVQCMQKASAETDVIVMQTLDKGVDRHRIATEGCVTIKASDHCMIVTSRLLGWSIPW